MKLGKAILLRAGGGTLENNLSFALRPHACLLKFHGHRIPGKVLIFVYHPSSEVNCHVLNMVLFKV